MRSVPLILALLGSSSLAAPLSAPRVAAYPGYTRLALDVPAGATYSLEPLGAALRVTFTGASVTAATVKVGKPELLGFTLSNTASGSILTLAVPQGVSPRSGFRVSKLEAAPGKTGYRLSLDLSGAFADVSKLTNPTVLGLSAIPVRPLTVLLDPGHGGPDSGALGNGIQEAALNLAMAYRVKAWLERINGVRVEMTRTDNTVFSKDKRTDLNARAQASRGKTVFVSIHANAVPRSQWNAQFGTEVYYFNPQNQKPQYIGAAAPLAVSPLPVTTASFTGSTVSNGSGTGTSAPPNATLPNATPPNATLTSSGTGAGTSVPGSTAPVDAPPVDAPPEANGSTPTPPPDSSLAPDPAAVDGADGQTMGGSSQHAPQDQVPNDFVTPPVPSVDAPTGVTPTPETVVGVEASTQTETAPASGPNPPVLSPISQNPNRIASSRTLAGDVLSRLLWAIGSSNRGVRTADFYVIKYSECPAILVEMGFVTHPVEATQLKNPNYLERTSYGIASGITAYLNGLLTPQ